MRYHSSNVALSNPLISNKVPLELDDGFTVPFFSALFGPALFGPALFAISTLRSCLRDYFLVDFFFCYPRKPVVLVVTFYNYVAKRILNEFGNWTNASISNWNSVHRTHWRYFTRSSHKEHFITCIEHGPRNIALFYYKSQLVSKRTDCIAR
mgnify:CR=1 FL=1